MAVSKARRRQGKARDPVIDGLERLLADTFTLYLKTHGYHWNVRGPQFPALHAMFEEQYRDMWSAVDVLAERIRALGGKAPQSFGEMSPRASIEEDAGDRDATDMVRRLAADHAKIIKTAHALEHAADAADDVATEGLAVQRIEAHQKIAWMLGATLR